MEPNYKANSLDKCNTAIYTLERGTHFLLFGRFRELRWSNKNQSNLVAPPLKWLKTDKFDKSFFPFHLDIIQKYAQEEHVEPDSLVKHFRIKMKSGTCHGECLALIEQIVAHPLASPLTLLKNVAKNFERVMFYQVLHEISSSDPERYSALCMEKYPARPNFHEYDLNQLIHEFNFEELKGIFIVRYQNEDHPFNHSCLYVNLNGYFWFYHIYDGGLYVFTSAGELQKQFKKHIKAFFPSSSKTFMVLEHYEISLSKQ